MTAPAVAQTTAIKAAMSIARDLAEGRQSAAQLDAQALDEARELFGTVRGAADALWPLHVDVARQVLARGGVPADELAEWLAVTRQADRDSDSARPASTLADDKGYMGVIPHGWIDQTLERLAAEEFDVRCVCGDQSSTGVVHRTDGPCYVSEL